MRTPLEFHLDKNVPTLGIAKLSRGATFAPEGTFHYLPGAVVPILPFADAPETYITERLPEAIVGGDLNFLGVVNLSHFLQNPMFAEISEVGSYGDLIDVKARYDFNFVCANLISAMSATVSCSGDYDIRDVCLKSPGLLTTTVDNLHRGVGLHLDSFDMKSIYERDNCRNRICINLGKEDRSFIFVHMRANELLEMLHTDNAPRLNPNIGSSLARYFFDRFRDVQVTMLRVRPHEAYVMPTENIIHDASTLGRSTLDISLTFLGRFEINSNLITRRPPQQA